MNTRHEKVFSLLGHEIRFTITSDNVAKLRDAADSYIESGDLVSAREMVDKSISIKGFESTDDTIIIARIERRLTKAGN